MTARRVTYLALIAVLLFSGAYLIVYLYRWEWNRAVIAGVFFVAAEIALIGAALFERLNRVLESKNAVPSVEKSEVLLRIEETAPRRSHFSWLKSEDQELGVFIPVLMGAGIVVSGIAWLVEKVAGATAKPVLESALAGKLGALSFPDSFLTPPASMNATRSRRDVKQLLKRVALVVVIAFASLRGLDALADMTQTRPDKDLAGTATTLDVEIYTNHRGMTSLVLAESLWAACQGTARREVTFQQLSEGRVAMKFEPGLGHHAEQRVHGCLEDALLDNVQARVLSVTTTR